MDKNKIMMKKVDKNVWEVMFLQKSGPFWAKKTSYQLPHFEGVQKTVKFWTINIGGIFHPRILGGGIF